MSEGADYLRTPHQIAELAQITATNALTDQLKLLGQGMQGLREEMHGFGADMKDVRERLIAIESSKIEARLEKELSRIDLRFNEHASERRRIEDKFEKEAETLHGRITLLANSQANMTGKLLPIGAAALILVTAAVDLFFKLIVKVP